MVHFEVTIRSVFRYFRFIIYAFPMLNMAAAVAGSPFEAACIATRAAALACSARRARASIASSRAVTARASIDCTANVGPGKAGTIAGVTDAAWDDNKKVSAKSP